MYNKGRVSGLRGITDSPQSSIFAVQNQNPALVIYSPQSKRNPLHPREEEERGGRGCACAWVCMRGGRHPAAARPVLPSGTLTCRSKSVPSPGSPGSYAVLSSVQPGLQPAELIVYLSAFEMRTEDLPQNQGILAGWCLGESRRGQWGALTPLPGRAGAVAVDLLTWGE